MGRKGSELTPEVKIIVVEMYQSGQNVKNIANLLKIPRTTIAYVIKRFHQRGTTENVKRSGRPSMIDDRNYRHLERIVKRDRRAPLGEITAKYNSTSGKQVSTKTVKRKLRDHGFRRSVYRKKVVIRAVNRKKRVSWCREKRWRTVSNFWKFVIFSDECQVCVGQDQRIYIWRKPEEGWRPDLVVRRDQRPVKVMVWGCVCYNGVGTLAKVDGNINAQKYIDIIEDNLWAVILRHFPGNNYLFQDDNAPVHRAKKTQQHFANSGIKSMSWPSQSPDLNIIENVWLYIKRKLQPRVYNIKNSQDLYREILQIWQSIQSDYIKSLYSSIPRRIKNVIRLKGHLTKY